MRMIATALLVTTVGENIRATGNSYYIARPSGASYELLIGYLAKFPLFSSKLMALRHLNYQNWLLVRPLVHSRKAGISLEDRDKILRAIRANHNTTRTTYNWDHLKYFPRLKS